MAAYIRRYDIAFAIIVIKHFGDKAIGDKTIAVVPALANSFVYAALYGPALSRTGFS